LFLTPLILVVCEKENEDENKKKTSDHDLEIVANKNGLRK
jgi:hypothetical protein